MKRIKCSECQGVWYVEDDAIDSITYCPFCIKRIRERAEILKPDTLSKAIYKVVSEQGTAVLESVGKITSFMFDIAPELKREIRIFKKTFDANYLKLYRDAFDMELGEAEATMNWLRQLFVEEEGLSEEWADLLCENCVMSIRYYKGNGLPEVITAEITDVLGKTSENDKGNGLPKVVTEEITDVLGKASENDKVSYESYIEITKYSKYVSVKRYISGDASFDIPVKIDGLPVVVIEDNAFKGCKNLTKVTIPDSVTEIGGSAFSGCESLTSITVPNSVTKIGDCAFDNCRSLTSVIIPDGVTQISNGTFWKCESLTSITIPNSVTKIGDRAFYDCKNLTSVTISDGVIEIGDSAFSGCESLTGITIPNSVTKIGDWAFWRCESLASITVPNSVLKIGNWAFCNCKSLKSVTIPKSIELLSSVFKGCVNIRITYQ